MSPSRAVFTMWCLFQGGTAFFSALTYMSFRGRLIEQGDGNEAVVESLLYDVIEWGLIALICLVAIFYMPMIWGLIVYSVAALLESFISVGAVREVLTAQGIFHHACIIGMSLAVLHLVRPVPLVTGTVYWFRRLSG